MNKLLGNKGEYFYIKKCYITLEISYIIHIFEISYIIHIFLKNCLNYAICLMKEKAGVLS